MHIIKAARVAHRTELQWRCLHWDWRDSMPGMQCAVVLLQQLAQALRLQLLRLPGRRKLAATTRTSVCAAIRTERLSLELVQRAGSSRTCKRIKRPHVSAAEKKTKMQHATCIWRTC